MLPRRVFGLILLVTACVAVSAQDISATRRPSVPLQPAAVASAHGRQAGASPRRGRLPDISAETRLLVIAPHPDDEVLGAGGLIQRVHEAGGTVRVIYLTDGDGYREAVTQEDKGNRPSFADYRGYGHRRQGEARAALGVLGLEPAAAVFLSFPDGGLCRLVRTNWSERRAAYRSPFTRLHRPPESEIVVPATEYRGEDLAQELTRLLTDLNPTLIVVPRKEDQHLDHSAAWFFLADAVAAARRENPLFAPDVLNYIVHFNDWPFADEGPGLEPPEGLGGGASGWIRMALTPAEVRVKHAAIKRYRTQMRAMGWFLDAFVRSNEVFTRPSPSHVALPRLRGPYCW
jgi:LmbE family N-acetylglucosaminyl deacetylase